MSGANSYLPLLDTERIQRYSLVLEYFWNLPIEDKGNFPTAWDPGMTKGLPALPGEASLLLMCASDRNIVVVVFQ